MIFQITLERMILFLVIFLLGLLCAKRNIIRKEYLPDLAKLITKFFLPITVFFLLANGVTRQMVIDNLPILPLTAAFYLICGLVLRAVSKVMRVPHDKDRVFEFCFLFGNTFFVAVPLFQALLPGTGVITIMVFTIIDQFVFWSYGVWLSTARDRQAGKFFSLQKLKGIVLSPNIIAMILGLIVIFSGFKMPSFAVTTFGILTGPTSALGMIYLGALAGFSKCLSVLKRPELYVGIVVKMIILPVIAGKLLMMTSLPMETISGFVLIMALPVMTVVPMVASQNGNEGSYATGTLVVTLVASVVTMPLVAFLAL